jgi:hypothetical protein
VTDRYESWKQRKIKQQQRRAEERTALLPDDLAEQILDAAEKERVRIQERIEVLDKSEARLDQWIEELAAEKLAATEPTDPERTVNKLNAHGESVEVTRGSDARRVTTPASREIGCKLRRLKQRKATHQSELRHRRRQLADVARVEAAARRGVVSAVLAITRDWQNTIDLGGLAPKVPLARRYCDVAGNVLDPEALDDDGQPAALPTARQAREEAGGPLVVEG